jgi:PAS domain S-box-containing protein
MNQALSLLKNPYTLWVLFTLLLGGVLLLSIWQGSRAELKEARTLAEETAQTYGLLTRNILSDLDRATTEITTTYLLNPTPAQATLTRAFLKQRKTTNPHVMDMLILDSEGGILLWSGEGPKPDVRSRSYYQYHRQTPGSQLYAMPPKPSLVHTDEWFFSLSRAVRDASGRLLGVGVAIISISELEKSFAALHSGENLSVGLFHQSGPMILRTPETGHTAGSIPDAARALDLPLRAPQTLTLQGLDQQRRLVALRPLAPYDLIVTGASNLELLYSRWARNYGLLGAIYLLISIVGWLLVRRLLKAHNTRKKALNELEAITKSLPGMVYRLQYDPRSDRFGFSYISQGIESLFGIPAKDALADAHALLGRIHPEDYDRVMAETLDYGQREAPWQSTFRLIHTDGHTLWVEARDSARKEHDGTLSWTGYANDVTEQVNLQEQLKKSEAKFRAFVENANDIIYTLSPDGTLTYVSPNWKNILGHDPAQVTGGSIAGYVHPEDLPRCMAFLQTILTTGESQSGIEYRVRHESGHWCWHLSNGSAIRDRQGRITGYLGIARDITEQKEHERLQAEGHKREQNLSRQLLIQQSKLAELGAMIGAIAHQWKQPLNAIALMSQELSDARDYHELNDELVETITTKIDEQVRFMNQTMEDFRSFYKPTGEAEYFNPQSATRQMLGLLEAQLKKARIHPKITGTIDQMVYGHPGEFKQVILNLVSNAKEVLEGRSDPELRVAFSQQEGSAYITLSDNGGGIDPALLPDRLFESFVTTKGEAGTGVGLWLARTIIEDKMGGRIEAQNSAEGARFSITLPLALKPADV